MEKRKTNVQPIDYTLLFLIFLLMCISLLAIYSAPNPPYISDPMYFVKRQLVWYVVGSFFLIGAMLIDYEWFKNLSIPLYGLSIALLLYVEFFGEENKGAQRWMKIGSFEFQPSEFVKVFLIIVMAHLLYKIVVKGRVKSFKSDAVVVGKIFAVGLPVFFLILKQPDLGTALVVGSIIATMVLMSGVSWRMISLLGGLVVLALATLVWLHNHHFDIFREIIHEHQMIRIYGWLDPEGNASSYGYQLVQAMQGIGAGRLYGSGFMQGIQSQSGLVPEIHTDFIFTIIGEEFGFIGATILIIVYFLLFYRMIMIAFRCNNLYGSFIIAGVIGVLVFQIFQNIAMTIGVMPITGIALPFISYGGSAIMTNMMLIGLVMNVNLRTRHYMFETNEDMLPRE